MSSYDSLPDDMKKLVDGAEFNKIVKEWGGSEHELRDTSYKSSLDRDIRLDKEELAESIKKDPKAANEVRKASEEEVDLSKYDAKNVALIQKKVGMAI